MGRRMLSAAHFNYQLQKAMAVLISLWNSPWNQLWPANKSSPPTRWRSNARAKSDLRPTAREPARPQTRATHRRRRMQIYVAPRFQARGLIKLICVPTSRLWIGTLFCGDYNRALELELARLEAPGAQNKLYRPGSGVDLNLACYLLLLFRQRQAADNKGFQLARRGGRGAAQKALDNNKSKSWISASSSRRRDFLMSPAC